MAIRAPFVAVLVVALAGCGSSSNTASTPVTQPAATTTQVAQPTQPKKSDYIRLADKACKHTNRRLKPIFMRLIRLDLSTQPIQFRLAGYRDAFHDLGIEYEDLYSELQQLEVPNRDHRLVTRAYRLFDQIPLHLDRMQAAITNLDALSLIRTEIKLNKTFVRLGGAADSYGFRVCGVIPGRHRRGEGPLPTAKNV
jgi:hypothetical protein